MMRGVTIGGVPGCHGPAFILPATHLMSRLRNAPQRMPGGQKPGQVDRRLGRTDHSRKTACFEACVEIRYPFIVEIV